MPDGPRLGAGPILVLEDDRIIAMDLADMIEAAGAEVRSASTLEEGMAAVEAGGLALALLDVNLGGGATSRPVAEALAARGVPFLLATGYGDDDSIAAYPDAAVLRKPYSQAEVLAAVAAALG